jgi:hypothetical protein
MQTSCLLALVFSSSFLSSFSSSVFAALIAAFLFGIIFPWYLDYRKRPKLHFISRISRERKWTMKKTDNKQWTATLLLAIKNEARATFKNYYWHLLVPTALSPQPVSPLETSQPRMELTTENLIHCYGELQSPLFSKSSFAFPYNFAIRSHSPGQWLICYYFNTEFGSFPKKAKNLEKHEIPLAKKGLGEFLITTED